MRQLQMNNLQLDLTLLSSQITQDCLSLSLDLQTFVVVTLVRTQANPATSRG